jgi:peptidoglycan hydrolase-like protein with peptidoglycan-binding domain
MRIKNGFLWRSVVALILCVLVGGLGMWAQSASAQTRKRSRTSQHRTVKRSKTVHARTTSLKKKRYYRRSRRVRGQKTPTADRISEIQAALSRDGSYVGEPNGKWDNATVEAMRRFQAGHGLNPTGKLDALTLQKLGLGSATAGLAPPYPPTTGAQAVSDSNLPANGNDPSRRQ